MLIALLYLKNKLNFCFVKYEKKQAKKKFFYISTQASVQPFKNNCSASAHLR